MTYAIPLAFVLTFVWFGFSGLLDPLILGLGAVSLGLVLGLCRRMGVVDGESVPLGLRYARLAAYVPWLAWEIVKANIDVARRILSPGTPRIAPRLLRVPAPPASELVQVIYANSVTLTPGTVSVDLRDGDLLVHALHADAAADLAGGAMQRKCGALDREAAG
jgi:multicomponent Na+:H+ antiporter subunit E